MVVDEELPKAFVWDESPWDFALWGDPLPEVFILDESVLDGPGVLAGDEVNVASPKLRPLAQLIE